MQPGFIDFLYRSHFRPQRWQQQTMLFVQQAPQPSCFYFIPVRHIRLPDEQEGKMKNALWLVFRIQIVKKVWNRYLKKYHSQRSEKIGKRIIHYVNEIKCNFKIQFLKWSIHTNSRIVHHHKYRCSRKILRLWKKKKKNNIQHVPNI